jgi:hypothetical protein
MTAPYIGFNLYLRGALAETWSLVWIPLVLWITDKAILQPKWRVFLTLIIAFISLTHVPSLLICTIFLLLYTISFLFVHLWKAVLSVISSIFVGFGIASFYLLPAILEKSFINTEIMRSDDIHKLNLLSFGFTETTSIVSRYVQPIFLYNCFVILTFICLIFLFHRHDKLIIDKTKKWSIILLILTFLMVDPSLFVWESSKTLQMIQFPWRLLGFFSFGAAVLLGLVVSGISQGKRSLKLVLLSIALVILLGNTLYIHKSTDLCLKMVKQFPIQSNDRNKVTIGFSYRRTALSVDSCLYDRSNYKYFKFSNCDRIWHSQPDCLKHRQEKI